MDKLSLILPNNPRVKNVDTSRSQPVRPGAPTFGRPEGITSSQRVKWSDIAEQTMGEDAVPLKSAPENMGPKTLQPKDKFTASSAQQAQDFPTYNKNSIETRKAQVIDTLSKKFFNEPRTDKTSDVSENPSMNTIDREEEETNA
ncbi:MAG: hypothetical protein ACOYOK_09825 [Pseudobdellovibrionaceae bacterium]